MNPKSVWPFVWICCLIVGCGRTKPDAALPENGTSEPARAKSESKEDAVPVVPLKPLAERSREEIQKDLVGTWKAKGDVDTLLSFDAQGRVPFLGKGDGAQVVEMDFLQGKVRYEIDTNGGSPKLQITRPSENNAPARRFEITRVTADELELLEFVDGKPPRPVIFTRIDSEAPAVMGDGPTSPEPAQPERGKP